MAQELVAEYNHSRGNKQDTLADDVALQDNP
jgi:hypothetical protein